MHTKCLVTGGAGFIGSNLVDKLIKQKNEVICIDNESADSNSKFYWNKNAKNYPIDINDLSALDWVFNHEKPSVVFHLAAEARIQPTIDKPQRACETNFVGTCNVLESCRKHNVTRLVYSSTSSVYGLKNKPPLKEDMSRDCLTPYSIAKAAGEDLCKIYYKIHGIETITLRYFNVYGERQPLRGLYAPVIGRFLQQKEKDEAMTIVGDGKQTRDFTHVSDAVNANLNAAFSKRVEAFGEVFNVGTGKNYAVQKISEMIGSKRVYVPSRRGEARDTIADINKAKKILAWEPKICLHEWIKNQK